MGEYILHLGRVSIGMGIWMLLVQEHQTPALRTLMATIFLCVLFAPILGNPGSFSLPDMPPVSALSVQMEADAWVTEAYIDQLVTEVKAYAGDQARVFITLNADHTIDTVTVYHAENIAGLEACIYEKLAPREVNIYEDEEDDA